MKLAGAILAAVCTAAAAMSFSELPKVLQAPAQLRGALSGSHIVGLVQKARTPAERLSSISTAFHNATLDHFDAYNNATFPQRYYVNQAFWNGTNEAPIFLYVGGEAALSAEAIGGGVIYDLAQDVGALLVGLEHRYYGVSQPFKNLTPQNLQFLSSQQALADLADFIAVLPKFVPGASGKVITFGGSYPGALAAWSRLKYPNAVHAAWSTSGPVEASFDFSGYMNVVANSLADAMVGGSTDCVNSLEEAFTLMVQSVESNDANARKEIADQFCICSDYSVEAGSLDTDNVISTITNNIAYSVQYNDQLGPDLTISALCSAVAGTSGSAALDAFAGWYMQTTFKSKTCPNECVDASYQAFLDSQDVTSSAAENNGVGIRSWTYQCCSAFSYWQTCETDSQCVFRGPSGRGDAVGMQYFTDVCTQDFDLNDVGQYVVDTNEYYGGNTTVADRVVYISGTVDPWHYLAVHETLAPESPAIFIPGMSHCQDLHSESATDSPQLKAGRQQAMNYIKQWLLE